MYEYLDINGVSVRYREAGKQEDPLVLVHGIAGFLEEWEPAMESSVKITGNCLGSSRPWFKRQTRYSIYFR